MDASAPSGKEEAFDIFDVDLSVLGESHDETAAFDGVSLTSNQLLLSSGELATCSGGTGLPELEETAAEADALESSGFRQTAPEL